MQVIRADDDGLKNAVIGAGINTSFAGLKIKSGTHYNQLGYDENVITGVEFAAKTPGSYANGIKVATIDSQADQILRGIDFSNTGISTIGLGVGTTLAFNNPDNIVGAAITQTAVGRTVATSTGTKTLDGYYLIRKNKNIKSSYSYECKECTIKRIKSRKKPKIKDWEYPDW